MKPSLPTAAFWPFCLCALFASLPSPSLLSFATPKNVSLFIVCCFIVSARFLFSFLSPFIIIIIFIIILIITIIIIVILFFFAFFLSFFFFFFFFCSLIIIKTFVCEPGMTVTGISRHLSGWDRTIFLGMASLLAKNVAQGAGPLLYCLLGDLSAERVSYSAACARSQPWSSATSAANIADLRRLSQQLTAT